MQKILVEFHAQINYMVLINLNFLKMNNNNKKLF